MGRNRPTVRWSCDFETTTDKEDCRVWAFAMCQIGNEQNIYYSNTIDGALALMLSRPGDTFYFHNIKFDGEFLISHLLKNGWEYNEEKRSLTDNQFSCLISESGSFYCMNLCYKGANYQFIDSLKIIPLAVEEIAKSFELELRKGKIDYDEYREPGHEITEEEKAYITNDVQIVAQALNVLFGQGLTRMTQGSNAMSDYKKIIGKKQFDRWFPQIDCDSEIRAAYRGGVAQVNKRFKGMDIGAGIVLDINSLYPYVMHEKLLPYGEPVAYEGLYQEDESYPLYVQVFTCCFKLRGGYMPTVQLKHSFRFSETEYLEYSGEDPVLMQMTHVDLDIFLRHYEIYDVTWLHGWKFRGSKNLFKCYVDKWFKVKEEATLSGNKGLRKLAKLMLNALYGKFGLNPNVVNKHPYLDDEGIVRYTRKTGEPRKPIYVPIAVYITSWARSVTINAAQSCYERFLYCDTDSLHLKGLEIPAGIDVHKTRLGAWDCEAQFERARFIRAKTYIEEVDGKLKVTCAGMPKECYKNVTWENFRPEQSFEGKLKPVHVPGGIVLSPTPFKIKS